MPTLGGTLGSVLCCLRPNVAVHAPGLIGIVLYVMAAPVANVRHTCVGPVCSARWMAHPSPRRPSSRSGATTYVCSMPLYMMRAPPLIWSSSI
jgi:hypothetical protein